MGEMTTLIEDLDSDNFLSYFPFFFCYFSCLQKKTSSCPKAALACLQALSGPAGLVHFSDAFHCHSSCLRFLRLVVQWSWRPCSFCHVMLSHVIQVADWWCSDLDGWVGDDGSGHHWHLWCSKRKQRFSSLLRSYPYSFGFGLLCRYHHLCHKVRNDKICVENPQWVEWLCNRRMMYWARDQVSRRSSEQPIRWANEQQN